MRLTAAILAVIGLGFFAAGVYRELHGSGSADAAGFSVLRYDLESELLGRTLHEVAVVPPEHRGAGLVVLLGDQEPSPQLLAELHDLGARAPLVLLADEKPATAPRGRWESHVLVEAVPDARERFDLGKPVAVGGPGAPAVGALDRDLCAAQPSRRLRPLADALRRCN